MASKLAVTTIGVCRALVGNAVKPITPETRQQVMPKEVPATLKLYLDGKIEQFFFRQDKPGVVFIMNVDSVEHAKATIETPPLVTEGSYSTSLCRSGRSPRWAC